MSFIGQFGEKIIKKPKNVDDHGRTTNACLFYKLTYVPSAQVS